MEASRLYYSFDIAPGYWNWLEGQFQAGNFASVEAVYNEISKGYGPLVTWAHNLAGPHTWLAETDDSVAETGKLAAWASSKDRIYRSAAVDVFMDSADLRLIAQASAIGATVVTRERPEPHSKKKIKIPDACATLGVPCVQPFGIYSQMGMRI